MSASPASTTFRDMAYALSPSWLRGFVGSRFMYAMAIQFDAISDSAAYAVRARFPDLAPSDAFQYLTNDRQIDQGFQEPQASWAVRLTQWLDRWAHAGSPFGVLMAVRGFVAPDLCYVATVNNNSVFDYYNPGGIADPDHPPQHFVDVSNKWIWDSESWPYLYTMAWWRVWVIITPSSSTWTKTTHKFGDGSKWGGGFTYGWSGTFQQATALRAQVKKWKAANTWVPNIIICFDSDAFIPDGFGDARPMGGYGTWSEVVNNGSGRPKYVASRFANAAYLDGVV